MLLSSLRLGKQSFARESQSLKHSNRTALKAPGRSSHIYSKVKTTANVSENLSSHPRGPTKQSCRKKARGAAQRGLGNWRFVFSALGLGPVSGDLFHP